MLPLRKRLSRDERGSVAPLVAVSMVALMAFVALGVDVGLLYVERQKLNSIADVAALSAVQFLPNDPARAESAAWEYLQKNGIPSGQGGVAVYPETKRVAVSASGRVGLTFAQVIGYSEATVAGGGTATVAPISGVQGAVPLGVAQADWKLYDQVVLKVSSSDGFTSPGNYNALALGQNGASMYEQNLVTGYPEWLRANQWIATETGNMATPTVRAAQNRLTMDPLATYETVTRDSPRAVLVPILKDFTVNGRGEVQIVGFGMFFLESVTEIGSDKGEITGRFLRMLAEGESDGTAPDFGLSRAKLVQ